MARSLADEYSNEQTMEPSRCDLYTPWTLGNEEVATDNVT